MRRALNVTPVGLLKTVGLVSAPVMESKFALWEFGVSPMPEMRHQVIERGRMFDTPAFDGSRRGSASTLTTAPCCGLWSGYPSRSKA